MPPADVPTFDDPIGLFPLPNVVLFPKATLPLQIFEPRYRAMVRDALADQGLIAMALLRPGYVAKYHTNVAEIAPVVCVGSIREHVQVGDGRYLINLLGLCRAKVLEENGLGEYRAAMLEPLWPQNCAVETDGQYAARRSLEQMLDRPAFTVAGVAHRCRAILASSAPLTDAVDLIAAALLPADAIEVRQLLLEELDVLRRASLLVRELDTVSLLLDSQFRRQKDWPHLGSSN